MHIGVLGINHKSSELAFRELLAKVCYRLFAKESKIARDLCCVLLSTCNRTEIYFSAEDLAVAHTQILGYLRAEIKEEFENKLYTYFGSECFAHLASVTAGLDSIILGESEIQHQVKMAYETTALYYKLSSEMHYLFQKCLKIGKQIRSMGMLTLKQHSLPKIMCQIAEWVFSDLKDKEVMFIGNSEINRKVMAQFRVKQMNRMTLCTRGILSVQQELKEQGIRICDWSELPSWKQYDMIVCGTHHSDYLLSGKDLSLSTDRESDSMNSTKLIFDLSMPRTVDPLLSRYPFLTLFNVEELGKLIDQKSQHRLQEVDRAETLVWDLVHKQIETFTQKRRYASVCQ